MRGGDCTCNPEVRASDDDRFSGAAVEQDSPKVHTFWADAQMSPGAEFWIMMIRIRYTYDSRIPKSQQEFQFWVGIFCDTLDVQHIILNSSQKGNNMSKLQSNVFFVAFANAQNV